MQLYAYARAQDAPIASVGESARWILDERASAGEAAFPDPLGSRGSRGLDFPTMLVPAGFQPVN